MIYKIRIVSDEVEDFRRDIIIDSEATFLELKDIICEATGFDPYQMSSFFICSPSWEKEKEITMEDMGVGSDMEKDVFLMEDSHLSDFIDGVGQKMLYTFDYFHDRSFFLQVKDEEYGQDLLNAECVLSRGEAPVQFLPLEDLTDKKTLETSSNSEFFDDEFSDSDEYNDEDIDGYEELTR